MNLRRVLLLADVGAVGLLYTLWSARPLWSDVALIGVLAVAVLVTWDSWATAAPRALRWPALAFLAAWVLSAAYAPDQLTAWRSVLGVLAYGLVFMLLGNLLAWGVTRVELYQALVIVAQVLMAAWLANWLMDGARLFGYRLRFDNTNGAALSVMLIMPALLVGRLRRLVLVESAAVMWLSASRSGALGLVAGLGALLVRRQAVARSWLLVGAMVVPVGLGLAARGDLTVSNGRAAMWGIARQMIVASPLIGQGPNSYKAWWMTTNPPTFFFGHAHNLYLNVAAETGLIGVMAAAWLVGALLLALARRGSSPWAVAALAATVGLLAHSVGDVPTTAPYITVTWLALARLGLAETAS